MKNVHFHISAVKYGAKGEQKHLVFAESAFKYQELLKACDAFGAEGIAICESPALEQDALLLQKAYPELRRPEN